MAKVKKISKDEVQQVISLFDIIVVFGGPCSGKSTFIKKNKTISEAVFDLDSLSFSLFGSKSSATTYSSIQYKTVYKLMECLIKTHPKVFIEVRSKTILTRVTNYCSKIGRRCAVIELDTPFEEMESRVGSSEKYRQMPSGEGEYMLYDWKHSDNKVLYKYHWRLEQ